MKSFMAKKEAAEHKWLLVDAGDKLFTLQLLLKGLTDEVRRS